MSISDFSNSELTELSLALRNAKTDDLAVLLLLLLGGIYYLSQNLTSDPYERLWFEVPQAATTKKLDNQRTTNIATRLGNSVSTKPRTFL
jgi:hypothetical protein